ncbi:hypothetical protein CW304_13330, partial [Bacillus sp. UFRGS-B20]
SKTQKKTLRKIADNTNMGHYACYRRCGNGCNGRNYFFCDESKSSSKDGISLWIIKNLKLRFTSMANLTLFPSFPFSVYSLTLGWLDFPKN